MLQASYLQPLTNFSPMIPLFEMWPGYGGIIYDGLNDGSYNGIEGITGR